MSDKQKKNTKSQIAIKHGQRFAKASEGIEVGKIYSLADAVKEIKGRASAKFDETVDITISLGVDVNDSTQGVRGSVKMPNGLGKKIRVAVFAADAKAEEAKKAGADVVGTDELVQQIEKGEINFERCIATPDMMAKIGRVAKVLGPRGLMPNPKLGTVTQDVAKAVEEAKAGAVEFRAEKGGIVHGGIGKVSFGAEKIQENIKALFKAVEKAKPSNTKGQYIKKASLSSTMGPSFNVNTADLSA